VEIKDYGVTVKLTRAQEALLHVSEISHDEAIQRKPVNEILAVGQRIKVMVSLFNQSISLSSSMVRIS
jgi:ribosomal protein S1